MFFAALVFQISSSLAFNRLDCLQCLFVCIFFKMETSASLEEAEEILTDVLETLKEYEFFDPKSDQPIVRFLQPAELQVRSNIRYFRLFMETFFFFFTDYILVNQISWK